MIDNFRHNRIRQNIAVTNVKGLTAAIDVYCFLHKGAFGCAELLAQVTKTWGSLKNEIYILASLFSDLTYNIY